MESTCCDRCNIYHCISPRKIPHHASETPVSKLIANVVHKTGKKTVSSSDTGCAMSLVTEGHSYEGLNGRGEGCNSGPNIQRVGKGDALSLLGICFIVFVVTEGHWCRALT